MKTPCALSIAVLAAAVVTAHPTHRLLQNFPPANGQGQFRPGPGPMGPNGGLQPQFGNVPMQGNRFNQFPADGQLPGMQNVPNAGAGMAPNVGAGGMAPTLSTGNTQTLGVGEADVTETGSATGANAVAPSTPADSATVTPAPGADAAGTATTTTTEPTIMVFLPDSLGTHSGWSSHSGDAGETTTKPPSMEKPAEADKPTETSAAPKDASMAPALALLTAAVSVAAVFAAQA